MGEAKRMTEAEEKQRNNKIRFIREQAPDFVCASLVNKDSDHPCISPLGAVDLASRLFDEIEREARRIAAGDK